MIISELDRNSERTYTKVGKNRGYVESTYQGGSILITYDLSEYKEKIRTMNLMQENLLKVMRYKQTGFLAISESGPNITLLFTFSQFLHLKSRITSENYPDLVNSRRNISL